MQHANRRRWLCATIISIISGVPAIAVGDGLEEVIVTAQKQEENLQQVPISISALGADAIEARGISGIGDVAFTVPNMSGSESPDKRGSMSITLRGVSSGSANISFDPANAVYMDGVYLGKSVGSSLDVADIERIEVLRGPQGTLYGRNSTGGAVNFVTRKPTGELHAKITGTAGNYHLRGLLALFDLPAIGSADEGLGTLAASLGVQSRQRDALYKNTNPDHNDFENMDRRAARLALQWQPRDAITVDYSFDISKLDEDGSLQKPVGMTALDVAGTSRSSALNGYLAAANAALNAGSGPLANAAAADPTFQRWYQSLQTTGAALAGLGNKARPSRGSSEADTYAKNETRGHSLTASWDVDDLGAFGNVTFKSISGYRKVKLSSLSDLDGFDNAIDPATGAGLVNDTDLSTLYSFYSAQANAGAAAAMRQNTANIWNYIDQFGAGYALSQASVDYSQWSEELQMVGATDQLDYVLGLYYFKDNGKTRGLSYYASPLGGINGKNFDNETKAKAAFAQFTYRPEALDQRLALTLGLRRTLERKDITYLYVDAGNPFAPPAGVPVYNGVPLPTAIYGTRNGKNFSNNSGMFNAAYQLTDDINVFAKYSTGYRSGGFNGDVFNNPFDEETIKQYELGVKSDWWRHRLRVNLALFQYTYDDQQVAQISVDQSGRTSTSIVNGGLAKRSGGELEITVAPIDDLLVSLNYGYIHGDFDRFASSCGSTGCLDTDKLAKRPQSASNQVSLVLDYTFLHLGFADLQGHLETYWQDRSYTSALWTGTYTDRATNASTVVAYDQLILDERTVVNARLSLDKIKLPEGSLRISLWGKNVFNQDYNTLGINFATLGPVTRQFGEPRTYGLDVSYEY
jgi:iron complex outermembrane receptor protein